MGHQCARPGCPVVVEDHRLACRLDWYHLPAQLRRRINAAWSRRRLKTGAENRSAVAEHRLAIAAAIAHWEGR